MIEAAYITYCSCCLTPADLVDHKPPATYEAKVMLPKGGLPQEGSYEKVKTQRVGRRAHDPTGTLQRA